MRAILERNQGYRVLLSFMQGCRFLMVASTWGPCFRDTAALVSLYTRDALLLIRSMRSDFALPGFQPDYETRGFGEDQAQLPAPLLLRW
jgi:hypothetical protein